MLQRQNFKETPWFWWGHIAFGLILLLWFRADLASGQLLPGHPWDVAKTFLAGFLFDFALWCLLGFLMQLRYFAWPALVFALLFVILNMSNLTVSSHFKAGIVNFRFIIDYLSELGPLTKTGGSLISAYSFGVFLFLPVIYWLWFFRERCEVIWFSKTKWAKLKQPGLLKNLSGGYLLLLTVGLLSFVVAEYIVKDKRQIVSANVLYRMVLNEYRAFQELKQYRRFAESLEARESSFPDKKHFTAKGYRFNRKVFPLYKEPAKIKKNPQRKPNIVIIMMESVAAKDTGFQKYTGVYGRNVTPFLTSLMPKSLIVPRFFSNADYTAGAEVAAFCSIHDSLRYSTGTGSILRSFTFTNLLCLPEILAKVGYHTLFLHSYTATFDHKNVFFPLQGVKEVIDKDDKAFKGLKQTYWGIQDIEMFRHGAKILAKRKQPFLAIFLTVTNHPPYILHYEKDRKKFGEEGNYENYLNTVHLTDLAIKEFFAQSQNEPWYKDTIFIITSDNGVIIHPKKIEPVPWQNEFVMWHMVPFIMFSPNKEYKLAGRILDLPAASHIDITPTVLDMLGMKIANPFAGESLFSKRRRGFAFVYDWFANYYRLAWPNIYHATDRRLIDLRSGAVISAETASYHTWVEKNRNFFNLMIFRNRVWHN